MAKSLVRYWLIMKLHLKLALLLVLCVLAVNSHATTKTSIRIPLGKIKGSLMSTRLNRTIFAFRGLRYAKAPEGERRFKVPEPVDAWNDVFDASKEGPACPQPAASILDASEDCLRLNVYTTKLPDDQNKVKRPVIVFFHPGGFYGFSAQSYIFGPQYILDQDIVLVTVNYRLGTLGFISTGDARAPGNLGLKDQVIALRWVQKNIAAFGGDPNSVTIQGYSAGSTSVYLHLMSPMSKGLFHRAIASSGAPAFLYKTSKNQTNLVIKQAEIVGCPTDSLDKAFECLKTVPAVQFGESLPKFAEWYGDPILIWSPVVEPELPGVERFLTEDPLDLVRKKQFQHVPLITGITKDEFSAAPLPALEQSLKGNNTIYQNMTEKWEFVAPICFLYERGTERSKYISKEIYKFYFNNEPITAKNGKNLGLIYADAIEGFPMNRIAQLMAENSRAPVYNYQFTYQGRYSFNTWRETKKPYGVAHHDDLLYLYYLSFDFPFFNATDPETKTLEKMTAMWANFAKTGEPIPKNNKLFEGVVWETRSPTNKKYLDIGENLTMKSNMFPDRYALYERLFPLPPFPCAQ